MSTFASTSAVADPCNAPLRDVLQRHIRDNGVSDCPIPGLWLFRNDGSEVGNCSIYETVFVVMAQGAKRIWGGEQRYKYDARHYLVSSVDMPMLAQVTRASVEQPMIGVSLKLDPLKVAALENQLPGAARSTQVSPAMAVGELDATIRDAVQRLVELLDDPESIPVLAPLREQELLYHLLSSPVGARLREVMRAGSHSHQIAHVTQWIRANLSETMSVVDMAERVNMSRSSFHQHFKSLTSMTPLQYQKQLRLQEARRLMLVQQADAAVAAFAVGYESASQFSREYRRMFGESPARDVARMTAAQGG